MAPDTPNSTDGKTYESEKANTEGTDTTTNTEESTSTDTTVDDSKKDE